MSSSTRSDQCNESIPWPKRASGVRIPVSGMKASAHLAGLDANARRAINERCRTWGSHLDRQIKELWPTNKFPPEWITVQRGEQDDLAMAVRRDIDELTRVEPFQKLRFEGEWFELRTAWESLSWWRKKGSLGASAGSPIAIETLPETRLPGTTVWAVGAESSTTGGFRAPARTQVLAQAPALAEASGPPRPRISTRPWER